MTTPAPTVVKTIAESDGLRRLCYSIITLMKHDSGPRAEGRVTGHKGSQRIATPIRNVKSCCQHISNTPSAHLQYTERLIFGGHVSALNT